MATFNSGSRWVLACFFLLAAPAQAIDLSTSFEGEDVKITLNNALTMGVGIRMQSASSDLLAKSHVNPNVCPPPYQDCQGTFRDQSYPAVYFAAQPGAPGGNYDRGDLNYKKHDVFQAPIKLTSDLTAQWRNFTFFTRVLGFYDVVNNHFTEYDPNKLTFANRATSGRADPTVAGGRAYGQGGVVYEKRRDSELLKQAGANIQFLDAVIAGKFDVAGHDVSLKLGRQLLNWGETTTLLINSISQATPVNANNVFRIGGQVEEYFTPVNMISATVSPFDQASLDAYYKLEWKPLEIPTPGTYFSDLNIGTYNAVDYININPGSLSNDPNCLGAPLDNPLGGATNTCTSAKRLPDINARAGGQFGLNFGYNFSDVGSGVQVNLSYQHYHSTLPYASFFATVPSCARKEGNALGIDATDIVSFGLACPDLPTAHLATGDPQNAKSNVVKLDSEKIVLEYPENIDLIGLSFNTSLGDYSLQGEVAYRPNKPLQIDSSDLTFASLGPALTACHRRSLNCTGSAAGGLGSDANGNQVHYGGSDFIPAPGVTGYNDTFAIATLGALPGVARSFPNFVIPYRGGTVGDNAPCYAEGDPRHLPYNRSNPCYIRGYERFQDLNFNFSLTRVLGVTDNWIGADQVILVYEAGAEVVPDLPALDVLPLQGPGAGRYGPTAGADGSGADGSRTGCSNIPDCSIGPDGARFNVHQQDHHTYPTPFSAGQRVVGIFKYESVLPGISLQPFLIYKHDLWGISPGPAGNFVRGRHEADFSIETRYKSALSMTVGYNWYWGGGALNTLSDRDFLQAFVRYLF